MVIAGNQSYFFPFFGYFQLINAVDKFTLYDNLDFSENGWVNHNNILLRNGDSFKISVPILNRSSSVKIRDLKVDDRNRNKSWRNKICKTLHDNYRRAPGFCSVYPLLESLIKFPAESISELNANAIRAVCEYVGINTTLESDPDIYKEIEERIADQAYLSSKYPGLVKRDARIIEICNFECADTLYNSMGGINLYNKETFKKYGITVKFLKRHDFYYKQFDNVFVPNLSIIDVLMFNEIGKIKSLLTNYELI